MLTALVMGVGWGWGLMYAHSSLPWDVCSPSFLFLVFAEEAMQPQCVQTKGEGLYLQLILLLTSARFIDRTP